MAAVYYDRFLDTENHILIETPGMRDVIAASVFPESVGMRGEPVEGLKWQLPKGAAYLLMANPCCLQFFIFWLSSGTIETVDVRERNV